jgi:ABC-2 type transport system permease protein
MGPNYWRVFLTFARNSLVRDMSFRVNFILECLSSISWAAMNWGLFKIIYQYTPAIGAGSGWREDEFFIFLGTIWIINSLVQTFVMVNAMEFSELIRTGNLDFALLKPIDTQFLISFPRINWSQSANCLLGIVVVIYYLRVLDAEPGRGLYVSFWSVLFYLFFLICGTLIMYSVMILLSSTSIWLGRNQHLSDFWFYITNFYRYPMEIYQRHAIGWTLWVIFTFVVPILVVSNVPARVLAQPSMGESVWEPWEWWFAFYTVLATVGSLLGSRWVFQRALASYRSASS